MKQVIQKIKSLLNIRSWKLAVLCVYALSTLYCANGILSRYIIQGSIESVTERPKPTFVYLVVDNFRSLLENSLLLNILTLSCVLLFSGTILYKLIKDKHKSSFYSLCILAYLLATLCSHPMWEYAATPFFHITYDVVFAIISVAAIITITIINTKDVFKPKHENANPNPTTLGLSVNDSTDHQDLGWLDYMSTLLSKINSTDLSNEAFTIGISGQWGSGKTTFLNELENQLIANSYITVRFNPWNCHSSQQVITSFFSTLVSAMNVKRDSIGEAFIEYSNILADLDVHPLLSKILRSKEKDVDSLKIQLQEQMSQCGRKIAILIDDIDRLDQDEVYETLRLIRETANFPNMVYFVAYDFRHVINMLAEKGIRNGNEYIRKIFQMEIPLPGYEKYILPLVLFNEIKKHVANKEDLDMIQYVVTCTTQNGEYLVTHYLKNFRDVKRFANSFIITYSHISTKLKTTEYCIRDLVWLELLHYSDLETYQKLSVAPLSLLTSYSTEKGPVYGLKNEYSHSGVYVPGKKKEEDESESPLAKFIAPEVPYKINENTATLLSMLFGLSIQEDSSIRYTENYNRYFAFRLPNNNIGTTEFRDAILSSKTSDEIEANITRWLTGFASKRQSLLRQMQLFEVSKQNMQVCKNYLTIIVYLIRTARPGTIDNFCKICLDKKKYPVALADELSKWLFRKLEETIPTLQFPWTWVYICKKLYPISSWREVGEGNMVDELDPLTLLSAHQLKELTSINFIHYMDWVKHPPITDITKRNSNLSSFINESIVTTAYDTENDETYSVNLVLDSLLAHYSTNKSDQFNEFIRPLTPDELCGYYHEELEDIQNRICNVFNSYNDFKHFVESCFIESDDIKNYYKSIGIENA